MTRSRGGHPSAMGLKELLRTGDTATGRGTKGASGKKGAGRGHTTSATRGGKTQPGSARFGMNKSKATTKVKPKAKTTGRGRGAATPRGLGRLIDSLTGKR